MRRLAIALLCACACGGDDDDAVGGDARPADANDLPAIDGAPAPDAGPPQNPLDGIGTVTLVAEGFMFLEGPTWRAADGVLLFSDIPASTIYRLTPPSAIDQYSTASDGSNGLDSDIDGSLLAAHQTGRRVSRDLVTIADTYLGMKLNSPNDLAVRADGTIYFTDPPYGISPGQQELSFNGVFRLAPGGALTAEWEGALSARPNGIALSPDESRLYVADTTGVVRRYDVASGGSLSGEVTLVPDAPNADGMAVDTAGNLFVTTSTGVRVYAPDGALWGTIAVPRQPANCGFGGADARTLYITAREGLYRVDVTIPGIP